jgi:hypothetical protein
MDSSKKVNIKWSNINTNNFKEYINPSHNGFAIITGITHFVIDFDEDKYNPPQQIKDILSENCSAIEKTPGGFHFWFKIDKRTEHFLSTTDITWENTVIKGLDIRCQKGICYVAPSSYNSTAGMKYYRWIKGDLSTATTINSLLLEKLIQIDVPDIGCDNSTIETFKDNNKITIKIIPKTKHCLVKQDYIHSQEGHSCFFLTKLKTCYSCTAHCFSHGKRKVEKVLCDALVEEFWPEDDDNDNITMLSDEYDVIKEKFEENNFKVLDPIGFYSLIDNRWIFHDRSQFKIMYENLLLSDNKSFIDKWLKDPGMRTYSKVSTEISNDPNIFVLPKTPPPSFIYTKYTCEPNKYALPLFDELIDIVSNRQESIKKYILNWLAHLLQKPLELPGVAIIFNGLKGAGKDTIGDFFGEYIIGSQYYQNYSNHSQYFEKHDTMKANKWFIKLEEINKKVTQIGANGEYFKASITSANLNINPKGSGSFNVSNYMRVMASCNNADPVNVEQNERRFVISVVSPEEIGNHSYWSNLRKILFTEDGALAVANMLNKRDISEFNPRILPVNIYLNNLQEETKDSILKFIEQVEEGEYSGNQLYKLYREYCYNEGIHSYSNTKFGTQLLYFIETGAICRNVEKKKTIKYNVYYIK